MSDLRFFKLRQEAAGVTIASVAEQHGLESDLARAGGLPRDGSEAAGVAASEPPLYYALEAIPYTIAFDSSILVRLQLMRLLSATLAGLTALFVYLFVREALPAEPWAWTTAGLGVADDAAAGHPLRGGQSRRGAVRGLCCFCSTSTRAAFRRGLTSRAGARDRHHDVAIGLLTKLNFIGLLPGAGAGLLALGVRLARTSKSEALRRVALAGAVALSPLLAAVIVGRLTPHVGVSIVTSNLSDLSGTAPF